MRHEQEIASRLSQDHLMTTARGASSIWLALTVLNPSKRGVLVPANICEVVIAAILHAGLEPVYLDVDPIIGNVAIPHLEAAPPGGVGVLIAVHHFGTPLPMRSISNWVRSRNIFLIENVCNSLGAMSDGQAAGTWGDAAVYSFGTGKILGVGEGGALAARDSSFLSECRRLERTLDRWSSKQRSREAAFQACLRSFRNHEELKDPVLYRALFQQYRPALIAGGNVDTSEKIAKNLKNLSSNLNIRNLRAGFYRNRLRHDSISHRPESSGEVCWRYTCHLPPHHRDGAVRHLRERNLPVSTWYPAVDRLFRERPPGCRLSGADLFERTVINLWVDPKTEDEVVRNTAEALFQYVERYAEKNMS